MRRKLTKSSHNSKMIWTLFIAAKDKRTDKIKRTGIPSNMVPCHSLALRLPTVWILLVLSVISFCSGGICFSQGSATLAGTQVLLHGKGQAWVKSANETFIAACGCWDTMLHFLALTASILLISSFTKPLPTPGQTTTLHEERPKESWINVSKVWFWRL